MEPLDPRDRERVRRLAHRMAERVRHDTPRSPGCYPVRRLDLVTIPLLTPRGVIPVRLQRRAMVALLRAILSSPGIQPWGPLSSYRSCEVQRTLYQRHLSGGPLAAPPGRSWHNVGLAFDLYPRLRGGRVYSTADRRALVEAGWTPLGAADPPHFEFRGR